MYTLVGVVVTEAVFNGEDTGSDSSLISANILPDYSYIHVRVGNPDGAEIASCVTGLGPNVANNSVLGGLYFNGNMLPNMDTQTCSSAVIQARPGNSTAGVFHFKQCAAFSTAAEGVYTCTLMNSSMMYQSVRLGIYFTGRSELFDLRMHVCMFPITHSPFISVYTAAPVLDSPSSSIVSASIGSYLRLFCISRGSPPDTFTWRKDNNPTVLQSTRITAVNYTNTNAVFCAEYTIGNVTASDSGMYTCTIINPIGNDSVTITVDVGKSLIQSKKLVIYGTA